jgi:hypothetical protein
MQDPSTLRYPEHANAYLVLKANIHVTLAVTRLRLLYVSTFSQSAESWMDRLYKEALLSTFGPPGDRNRAGMSACLDVHSVSSSSAFSGADDVCRALLSV